MKNIKKLFEYIVNYFKIFKLIFNGFKGNESPSQDLPVTAGLDK
jgi:hypothetical protein